MVLSRKMIGDLHFNGSPICLVDTGFLLCFDTRLEATDRVPGEVMVAYSSLVVMGTESRGGSGTDGIHKLR